METLYDNSWAVLIGAGSFKYEQFQKANLVEPKNDVEKIKELLLDKCDFQTDNVKTIIDNAATLENIKNIFDDVAPQINENDRFLVFYSGHGITRKLSATKEIGFLIPFDAKPRGKSVSWATLLEFNELVKHVNDRIVAKQKLFLIDCCFSGIVEKAPEYELQRELCARDMVEAAKNKKCVQIFTASNRDEEILASSKVNPPISIFTESIVRFVIGANPNKFPEGFISGRIMSNQVKKMVREASIRLHKSQTPQFYFSPLDQNGEFVFKQFTENEITDAKAKLDIIYEPLEQIIKKSNLLFLFQDQNVLAIKRLVDQKFGSEYTLFQLQNLIRETILGIKEVNQELERLKSVLNLESDKLEDLLNYVVINIISLGIRKGDFQPHLIEVIENKEGESEVRGKIE